MEQFIEDSSLEGWKLIGSGGFGQVYKARHRQWACDVAIKLNTHRTNKSLLREINMMQEASSPHVIRVRGVFKGQPPKSGWATQLGVVMELMERGSLEALIRPPPWPLVFRLAHQVALGINFLHSLPRPVLHLDLKPQNVLLDDALNAKVSPRRKQPYESKRLMFFCHDTWYKDVFVLVLFVLSCRKRLVNSSNVDAKPTRVQLLIPQGQRPLIDDIKGDAAGLTELTELMQRCWDNIPEKRPQALAVVGTLFLIGSSGVLAIWHTVSSHISLPVSLAFTLRTYSWHWALWQITAKLV
uniref:Protein kinase domain-containing protein n=1 Tax=Sander lucioperca TaxID=283035 RepID=A0A8C9ZE07_SANLU